MKRSNHTIKRLFMVTVGLLYSIAGQASTGPLAGKDMQLKNLLHGSIYPGTLVNFTVPVTGTIQFNWGGNIVDRSAPMIVDVSDTGSNTATITLTETIPTAGAYYFSSPNLALFSAISPSTPTFTNVTLDSSTTAVLFDPARVQFTGTTFSYDFGGLPVVNGGFIQMNITTIPLPAAVWLFGSGLIGLASFTRRKNKSANLVAA